MKVRELLKGLIDGRKDIEMYVVESMSKLPFAKDKKELKVWETYVNAWDLDIHIETKDDNGFYYVWNVLGIKGNDLILQDADEDDIEKLELYSLEDLTTDELVVLSCALYELEKNLTNK